MADDDVELLGSVCECFTGLGANVIRASNGADLIEQLAIAGPFDLIVTDINMPWMNGLEAIRSTRAAGLATSVIVMTALADERIAAQVKSLGTNAVLLRKPFTPSELETTASALVGLASHGHSPRKREGAVRPK